MDRRRFLKYAAVGAAVAGSALAGYEFDRWQTSLERPSVTTRTVTEFQTLSETITETARLASLQGRLFFDYNGNGVQDGEEPPVVGASVQLKDDAGKVIAETLTDSSGDYRLEDVRTGAYSLHVEADKKFHYMCRSTEEFKAVTGDYQVSLEGTTSLNIGLMEGFLTSPFQKGKSKVDPHGYADLDPRPDSVRDWKGGDQTYDGHKGTDFIADRGTEILAAAPGKVFYAWNGWPNKPVWGDQNDSWKNGNSMIIDHGNDFWSSYNHLDSIAVDEALWGGLRQSVKRGDVIGYCGYTGFLPDLVTPMTPNQVHLHFQMTDTDINVGSRHARDPFRDLYYGQHGDSPISSPVSLWTKDNYPQFAQLS